MSSQPPWETQIQPGWGSQPQPPNEPQQPDDTDQPPQQPPQQQSGDWNQGSYTPPQPPQAWQPPQPPPAWQPPQPPQPAQPAQASQGSQPFPPQPQLPQQPPQAWPPPQPPQASQPPQAWQPPQQDHGPWPQYSQQPPPPQFTPPQMPGMAPYQATGATPPPPKKQNQKQKQNQKNQNQNQKNTGRVLAITLTVVVLLGAAGGIFLLTKGGSKTDTKAQPVAKTSSTAPATTAPASSSSASFPDNSYSSSAAPPSAASSTAGGASLDNASTDKTPFTAQALVASTFTDDLHVDYVLKNSGVEPCDKVGDAIVQTIVRSAPCNGFLAASWIDPDNNRIVVSAMVIPYQDATTAAAIYKKLATTHTGDYAQWCPPLGQPGNATCPKLAGAHGPVTREGKFGSFHRYVLITTAVYVDLRNDDSQKNWLTSAAHGAFQNTLPGQ